jgi:hypothetical protein
MITSQSMNAMDIIDYCLHMAVSEKDPPAYFITNLLETKAYLISQNNVYTSFLNRLE